MSRAGPRARPGPTRPVRGSAGLSSSCITTRVCGARRRCVASRVFHAQIPVPGPSLTLSKINVTEV